MDSPEPAMSTSSSARPTRGVEKSSENDGPECPSSETLALSENQRGELLLTKQAHQLTSGGGKPGQGYSAVAFLAKTSQSPDAEQDSPASEPASSLSSPESLSLFDPSGFSSRTFPVSSLATAVGTSESCLERWPTSGTAWRGGFSTHVSSECRSADGECSSSEPSLTEILEPPQSVPERYSLSARAARGILRRAEKRGRTLPAHLEEALATVAGMTETRSTGGGHSSLSGLGNGGPDDNDAQVGRLVPTVAPALVKRYAKGTDSDATDAMVVAAPLTKGSATGEGVNAPGRRQEDDVNIVAFHPTGGGAKGLSESEDVAPGTGTGTGTGGTVAIAGTLREHVRPGSNTSTEIVSAVGVRRLTPTECERLQGLPDGWTQLGDTPDSRRYSALGDAVTATVAEWIGGRLAAA